MAERPTLTTTAGNPIANKKNSISAGSGGALLMQDCQRIEKLAHRGRARTPERVVCGFELKF